jgi:hypothetical protein
LTFSKRPYDGVASKAAGVKSDPETHNRKVGPTTNNAPRQWWGRRKRDQ